jgi:hypothetical protein
MMFFSRPAKILTNDDKEIIMSMYYRSNIQKILIDDWLCIQLGAQEDDIICIRDNNTDIYRMVIVRNSIL